MLFSFFGGNDLKRIRFKSVIITLAALLLILSALILGLQSLWGIHRDAADRSSTLYTPELEFTNAPEGTAYIDPLVRLDVLDKNYTEFTTPPHKTVTVYPDEGDMPDLEYALLGIDGNSEITRYYEDGYISLSLHYRFSGGVVISEHGTMFLEFFVQTSSNRIDRFSERWGGFRAAYVDENGNVLGVTEPAELVYDDTKNTAFLADGSSLTLRVWGIPKRREVILNVLIIAEPCVFAALIAVVIIALVRRTWARGELDNTDNSGYNSIMDGSPERS